jgi:fatty acid desaturase
MSANAQPDTTPGKTVSRDDYITPLHGFMNVARLLAGHFGLVAWFIIGWHFLSPQVYIPVSIVLCQFHHRELNDWAHEACHWNLVPNRKLNDFLGHILASFWFGVQLTDLRRSHFIHHRTKTFFESGDPETGGLIINSRRELMWGIAQDLTGYSAIKHYLGFMLDRTRAQGAAHQEQQSGVPWPMFRVVLMHGIIFAGLIWLGRWDIYVIYYGTLATVYRLSHRIRIYAQHLNILDDESGTCENSVVSRTVRCNLLSKLIYASDVMLYHNEHHKQPGLPYRAIRHICKREYNPNVYVEQMKPVHTALWRM